MRAYWEQLSERERWMVLIGGILLGLYVAYTWIYSPLVEAVEYKTALRQEKQATLIWMKEIRQQFESQPKKRTLSEEQFLSWLSTTLSQQPQLSHFPHQLKQVTPHDIQLTFQSVPYSTAMLWLWSITQQYQITINQMNVDATHVPGVVMLHVDLSINN